VLSPHEWAHFDKDIQELWVTPYLVVSRQIANHYAPNKILRLRLITQKETNLFTLVKQMTEPDANAFPETGANPEASAKAEANSPA